MILGLMFMMTFFGFILALMGRFMPYGYESLGLLLWLFGLLISFVGMFLVFSRAHKTGVFHFLDAGRPGDIKWFYVEPDGTVTITASMREVEECLYSKELGALIKDLKSYRLFDHSVRFVPAGIGHSADLDIILYCTMLKSKYSYNNIREAREAGFKVFGLPKMQEVKTEEQVVVNPEYVEEPSKCPA